jgi:hypothetical protein
MRVQALEEAIRECDAAERAAGFDRLKAEQDLGDVMRSLGMGTDYIPCCTPGVVPYAYDDRKRVDVARIQAALEQRGYKIAKIDAAGWIDGEGNEALAVAFDAPCLDHKWRIQPFGLS